MEANRRSFLKACLRVTAVVAVPVLGIVGRVLPARYVEAVRARLYPGPVRDPDETEYLKPGRWRG
jgi:hypothetical protein